MIFVDKENRALHDFICDTRVIYSCNLRVVKKVRVEKVYTRNEEASVSDVKQDAGYSFLPEDEPKEEVKEETAETTNE